MEKLLKFYKKNLLISSIICAIAICAYSVSSCNRSKSTSVPSSYNSNTSYSSGSSKSSSSNSSSSSSGSSKSYKSSTKDNYDYDKGYGYTAPKEGESFSDYVKRQDPELYEDIKDRYESLK